MDWLVWVLIGSAFLLLLVDWFIVMGPDPKKWKGGIRKDEHSKKR